MRNLSIMMQFIRRDMKMYSSRMLKYLINDALIRPALYSLIFGYVFPRINVQSVNPGIVYVGSILYVLIPLAYGLNIDYLLDIEREKSIEYKLTLLPAGYFLLGRALITALIMGCSVLLFFPIALLLLGTVFDFSNAQPVGILLMSFSSALCVTSFVLCFMSFMKGTFQSRLFWRRTVFPLVMFGGFLASWQVMFATSSVIGYLVLLNPLLYVTEGLRNAFFGGNYIPWYVCVTVLVVYSGIFLNVGRFLLKRNIDYV